MTDQEYREKVKQFIRKNGPKFSHELKGFEGLMSRRSPNRILKKDDELLHVSRRGIAIHYLEGQEEQAMQKAVERGLL